MYADYDHTQNGPDDEERFRALMSLTQWLRNDDTEPPRISAPTATVENGPQMRIVHIDIVNLSDEEDSPPPDQHIIMRNVLKERRRILREIGTSISSNPNANRVPGQPPRTTGSVFSYERKPRETKSIPVESNRVGQPIMRFLLPDVFAKERQERENKARDHATEFAQALFSSTILNSL